MTTCVPIKLGGVRTHRLVMRAMCWQPGNRQAFFKEIKIMQYIAYLWNGRTHDKYALLSYVGEEELDAFKKRVKSCYPYTQGWYAEFSVFERI